MHIPLEYYRSHYKHFDDDHHGEQGAAYIFLVNPRDENVFEKRIYVGLHLVSGWHELIICISKALK